MNVKMGVNINPSFFIFKALAMERIELDVDYGLLTVKYPYNDWKKRKLEPLKLRWNDSKGQYETSSARAMDVIEHIKAIGSYVSLSPRIQELTNLNAFGQSKDAEATDILKWEDHHSFAASPSEDFNKEDVGFKDIDLPFGYQYAGIEAAKKHNGRILIADDMGLGKTLQACGVIGLFRDYLPAVIVCPTSVLYNWKTELLKFLDFLDEDDIAILDSGKARPEQLVSICSYRYAVDHSDELKEFLNVNGILVVDEAHTGKERDTQVGEAIIDLAHYAKCYLPLTGTPILNYVYEIFAILHGLDPVRWNDYKAFTERYCEGHWKTMYVKGKKRSIWYDKGASNLEELMEIVRNDYMVRRLKVDVLDQLPPKHRTTMTLNLTKEDAAFDEFIDELKEVATPILAKHKFSASRAANEVRQAIGLAREETEEVDVEVFDDNERRKRDPIFKLYEDSGLSKVENVVDSVCDILEAKPESKFIFFFEHKSVLNKMKEMLRERHPEFDDISITGDINSKKREDEKIRYQEDPNCKFAYLTIGAGYAAITLTAANVVCMVQQPWSPKIAEQCEDRAHRIGQEKDVSVIYFLSANKFDSYQHRMLTDKSDTSTTTLDGARGARFETNKGADTDAFSSQDAFVALLSVIAEDIQEEMTEAA